MGRLLSELNLITLIYPKVFRFRRIWAGSSVPLTLALFARSQLYYIIKLKNISKKFFQIFIQVIVDIINIKFKKKIKLLMKIDFEI